MTLLSVQDISKSFVGKGGVREVLDGISFDVAEGEFVSVIGPSGCGKSTLFSILAGLELPGAGRVEVNGADVTGDPTMFAFMPQKDLMLPWKRVIDNAGLALEIGGMRRADARNVVADLMPQFGLQGFEQAWPSELSGGMRQRVALLRTVVQDRPILLLDEPFGALDSLTRTAMQLWLTNMAQANGWTVILITHDIREAIFLSDKIVVLSSRPATTNAVHHVGLVRPRQEKVIAETRFTELELTLLGQLDHTIVARPSN